MASTPTPLPPDVRLMNGVAALLVISLLLTGAVVGAGWLAGLPVFALREIQVVGDVERNGVASLRANALPHLAGNFLTMDLEQTRVAFEGVPWVRHAVVKRVWPMRLLVRLEEHHPAALWETKLAGADEGSEASVDKQLVNSFGEVFSANLGDVEDDDLPVLAGPEGNSAQMLAMWQQLDAASRAALDDSVERLDLSGRGSWRATLKKGSVVELGRGTDAEVQQRWDQYVRTVTQITSRYHTEVLTADLRNADGYAVHLRGITTTSAAQAKK